MGMPVNHAWLMRDESVIDPTWISISKKLDPQYFGIEIPFEFILDNVLRTQSSGQLLWEFIAVQLRLTIPPRNRWCLGKHKNARNEY